MFSPSKRRPFATIKTISSSPTTFHRLSYRNVGCTSTSVPAVVVSCIRHGSVVSAPKASRFMKLPQRPMARPISSPITIRSVSAPSLKPRFLLSTKHTSTAAITPP